MILPDNKFYARLMFILPHYFGYRPTISIEQFFKYGFAESKILLVLDIISLIKLKYKFLLNQTELKRKRPKSAAATKQTRVVEINNDRLG